MTTWVFSVNPHIPHCAPSRTHKQGTWSAPAWKVFKDQAVPSQAAPDQLLKIWQMQKAFMKWVLSSPEKSQSISLPCCSGCQRNVFSEAEAALGPLSCFSQGSRGTGAMLRPLASNRLRFSSRNPQMPSQPQLWAVTRASPAASALAHREGKEKAEASPLPTNKVHTKCSWFDGSFLWWMKHYLCNCYVTFWALLWKAFSVRNVITIYYFPFGLRCSLYTSYLSQEK